MFDSNRSASSNEFVTSDNGSKRTLAVGLETFLKGEISNCDRVVIEGGVDAVMGDVQSLEIAASGSFTGSATVQNAEISGTFEGDLIVGNRLVIHSTGRVTGKVSYGEIEVKRGGKLLGEITCNDQAVSQTDSGFSSFANNNDTSNKKVVDDASIAPMPVAEAV